MKIATLCTPDADWFLPGIENVLASAGHEVQRHVTLRKSEIDAALKWADVVWAEFANELAAYAAAHHPHVVVRLHSYEAYKAVELVPWERVKRLVHTSAHVLEIAKEIAPSIVKTPAILIPSAVDLERFAEHPRGSGFSIGTVAWVKPEKNLGAVLAIVAELRKTDPRYTLEIAGDLSFRETAIYLRSFAAELDLPPSAFRLLGHVADIPAFWRGKDYAISASTREGCPYNVLEAAACGVQPLVHTYFGARDQFPASWLWRTTDEAVGAILSPRPEESPRAVVAAQYDLAKQAPMILATVEGAAA